MDHIFYNLSNRLNKVKTLSYIFGFESPMSNDPRVSKYIDILDFVKKLSAPNKRKGIK